MRAALTCFASLALLAACTDPPEAPPEPAPTSTSATPPTESVSPTPEVEPSEPITIAFAGDIHFEGPLRERLDDPATALAPFTETLAAADLAVVNLETSVGEGGAPEPGKRFTFQAPPSAFDALTAAGVDVATMANNHALDYGREALSSTFAAMRRTDLKVVGIGRDVDEAFRPAVVAVRGATVAVLGATQATLDPTADPTGHWAATPTRPGTADAVDPTRLLRSVEAATQSASVVVVYLHWGIQGDACPSAEQRELAVDLLRRGADVVVGSHAHVVQSAEQVGAAYLAYGLGNYAWYQPSDTGVLTLTVQPPAEPAGGAVVTDAAWEPARIGADGLPAVTGAPGQVPAPGC